MVYTVLSAPLTLPLCQLLPRLSLASPSIPTVHLPGCLPRLSHCLCPLRAEVSRPVPCLIPGRHLQLDQSPIGICQIWEEIGRAHV